MFSIFRKKKLDTTSPERFRGSIIEMNPSVSDLHAPAVFHSWMKKPNQREYMMVLEDLSVQGRASCQEFVTQFYVIAASRLTGHKAQEEMYRKALKFGEMAADSGVGREAMNLPLTALKLGGILAEQDTDEAASEVNALAQFAYSWHLRNSKNPNLSVSDRRSSAKQADELREALESPDD